MNFPISTSSAGGLLLAALFGLVFGILLNKGRVTDYNVIVNLFRFRDWTVLRIMLTAILLGGGLFGVGMVVYGYCPGTGVAAIATGSLHALVGALGMLVGGILYAVSFGWVKANILSAGAFGKVRLTDLAPIPEVVWWVVLGAGALLLFKLLGSRPEEANGES